MLTLAARYAAWATLTDAGRARHPGSVLFHLPAKVDPLHLVHVAKTKRDGVTLIGLPEDKQRRREGFGLTDPRMDMDMKDSPFDHKRMIYGGFTQVVTD